MLKTRLEEHEKFLIMQVFDSCNKFRVRDSANGPKFCAVPYQVREYRVRYCKGEDLKTRVGVGQTDIVNPDQGILIEWNSIPVGAMSWQRYSKALQFVR